MKHRYVTILCITALTAYCAYMQLEGTKDIMLLSLGGLIGHLTHKSEIPPA